MWPRWTLNAVEGLEEAVGEVLLMEEVEPEVAEEEGRVLSTADKEVEWGKMVREIHLVTKVEDRALSAVEKGE